MEAQVACVEKDAFWDARESFDELIDDLSSVEVNEMTHSELEGLIETRGNEVLRRLLQAHLDQRGDGDVGSAVIGADGEERWHKRLGERGLMTVFGEVRVSRAGYRSRAADSVFPLDEALNLPTEMYSHGVRRRVAQESSRGSYAASQESLERYTGAKVPMRQAQELAVRAAQDFDAFYARRPAGEPAASIVVLTTDGKGVPMRREHLRESTRRAAEGDRHRLQTRLSKGEKRHTRRMATVASVYTIDPFPRDSSDVVREFGADASVAWMRPKPVEKRVWASLDHTPEEVIDEMYREALRRDPKRERDWVVLVDGSEAQLRRVRAAARSHGASVTIILDLVHVIEYLWSAAYVFHEEGTPAAEAWVRERLHRILQGQASSVAAGMRRSATRRGISKRCREPVDTCAGYLLKYTSFLRYDEYLEQGLPIATGVIEGACRHLIADRLAITGARWSLEGAEAVLRLRALQASGDFDDYWSFHERQERKRIYADGIRPIRERADRHTQPTLQLVSA